MKSILLTAQAFVPHMRAQGGGVFINVGSTAGLRPRPGLTVYNASKGAVHVMTKSMAVELAPDKIRVCALAPVAGETPLLAMFLGEDTPEKRAAFKATVPLGRFSTPQDIGAAALFLASDEAAFLTGVVLEVDGGRCISSPSGGPAWISLDLRRERGGQAPEACPQLGFPGISRPNRGFSRG